jgi:hypothetical protein
MIYEFYIHLNLLFDILVSSYLFFTTEVLKEKSRYPWAQARQKSLRYFLLKEEKWASYKSDNKQRQIKMICKYTSIPEVLLLLLF